MPNGDMIRGIAPLPELVVFDWVEFAAVLAEGGGETTVVMPLGEEATGLEEAAAAGVVGGAGAEEAFEGVDAGEEEAAAAGVVSAREAGPLEPSIWPAGAVEGGGEPVPRSWPAPQAIFSPSGCVALGGAVTVPLASVMAQRPVQVTLGIP